MGQPIEAGCRSDLFPRHAATLVELHHPDCFQQAPILRTAPPRRLCRPPGASGRWPRNDHTAPFEHLAHRILAAPGDVARNLPKARPVAVEKREHLTDFVICPRLNSTRSSGRRMTNWETVRRTVQSLGSHVDNQVLQTNPLLESFGKPFL